MGWPTKGTGKKYNSHTGFGAYLEEYNNKVLMSHILCRICRICKVAKKKQTPVQRHGCVQNWSS